MDKSKRHRVRNISSSERCRVGKRPTLCSTGLANMSYSPWYELSRKRRDFIWVTSSRCVNRSVKIQTTQSQVLNFCTSIILMQVPCIFIIIIILLLFIIIITTNKCTLMYYTSVSLHNKHSYMFRLLHVIIREFYIFTLLSYINSCN